MEALKNRQDAVTGWKLEEVPFDHGDLYAAVPPTPRHYLRGMTPGATPDGRTAYLFLRKGVAEATIAAHAQIRGAES